MKVRPARMDGATLYVSADIATLRAVKGFVPELTARVSEFLRRQVTIHAQVAKPGEQVKPAAQRLSQLYRRRRIRKRRFRKPRLARLRLSPRLLRRFRQVSRFRLLRRAVLVSVIPLLPPVVEFRSRRALLNPSVHRSPRSRRSPLTRRNLRMRRSPLLRMSPPTLNRLRHPLRPQCRLRL